VHGPNSSPEIEFGTVTIFFRKKKLGKKLGKNVIDGIIGYLQTIVELPNSSPIGQLAILNCSLRISVYRS
jgi:hypothetical protein